MSTAEIVPVAQPKKPLSIRDQLRNPSVIEQIGKALPKHMDPDRMARIALTALTKTPKLAQCTQESFFKCLIDLSSWGLEPDGRRAHLIPYGTECTLIIDYKGLVELAYRSGQVASIHADVVYEGDLFTYNRGMVDAHCPWTFRPSPKPEKKGEVIATYCFISLQDGATKCEVMTKDEVEAIRNRSRSGQNGPWKTDWNEMAKKTVFRRASKWIPLSSEVHDAFEREDEVLPAIDRTVQKGADIDLGDIINGSSE
jgi:recombination protein RecT